MGIASMVIGILAMVLWLASLLFSFFTVGLSTCCSYIMILPSMVGLVLGIVDMRKQKDVKGQKGMAISGVVLNALYLLIQIGTIVLTVLGLGTILGAATLTSM